MKRNLDQLGRVVIPSEMREELDLKLGEKVNIEIQDEKIIIDNPNKENLKDKIRKTLDEDTNDTIRKDKIEELIK